MADQNPTGDGPVVALTIPPGDFGFLRSTVVMTRDGLCEELAKFSEQLREPQRLHREVAVYGRILDALDERLIVADRQVQGVLLNLAEVIDTGNEYSRVVAEHRALHGLLDQITAGLG